MYEKKLFGTNIANTVYIINLQYHQMLSKDENDTLKGPLM